MMKPATILFLLLILTLAAPLPAQAQSGKIYYVSFTDGADTNSGLTQTAGPNGPFKSIARVNSLNLQPGDTVLFKCGDTWRGEMMVISNSGDAGNPLTFSSYLVSRSTYSFSEKDFEWETIRQLQPLTTGNTYPLD